MAKPHKALRGALIAAAIDEEYLARKPEMKNIVSMSSWINPRNQNPAYDACANLWRTALYEIFNNNAPIQETLDQLAVEITETLADQ